MLRSSLPVGRYLGVDVRVHLLFPLLLLFAVCYSIVFNGTAVRGIGLWAALCLAVLVREIARTIAAAYAGFRVRALFLLPVGGVMAFSPRTGVKGDSALDTRLISMAGPFANFTAGLLLLGVSYALDPHVSLLAQPWIGTSHILRSTVWIQIILGAMSLLPASTMPASRLLRLKGSQTAPNSLDGVAKRASAFTFGTGLAIAMILAGIILRHEWGLWLIIGGGFMRLSARLSSHATVASPEAEAILVRDVMLTEYTLLSTTDTLRDALQRTTHSLQDVFPVVRGDRLVGSIARQTLADRLLAEGDIYLQGIMTRSLQTAGPSERLVDALKRSASMGAGEFIPVVEDGAMLGILTPQSLGRAVQQIQLTRPEPEQKERP
jgi:CBS domain-containing protein